MPFDPAAYGPHVAAILTLDPHRVMPLVQGACSSEYARRRLQATAARELFPRSGAPEAARAGLYLYFGCWEDAHNIAQDLSTPEANYWHAIVHRQEPDAWNAGYWFRLVGAHPIFPDLCREAARIGPDFGARWDPFAFVEFCERARQQPGGELERQALAVQEVEWQLLFHYCAIAP